MTFSLYFLQRITAALMVPLVVGHLVVIFHATASGLSAGDILGRTKGSVGWGVFYAVFVVLAAIHGAIGVRSVAADWTHIHGSVLDAFMWVFAAFLVVLGFRAVAAVVLP